MPPDYARIYARQEHLTPGAPATIELIAETVQPSERSLLLDVAAGKGEAAATLAGRFACRILAVDIYDPFIHYAAAKFWFFNLRDLVAVVRADGKRLPVRASVFDAAYCLGAPTIIGLDAALPELARATKPGGSVIVSDIVWRRKPERPLGSEWKWVAEIEPKVSLGEYRERLGRAGLRVQRTHVHPREDWEKYWRPMLQVAEEAKASQPADIAFADDVEMVVALERRAADEYIDYVTLIARKE